VLDVAEEEGDHAAREVEKVDCAVADETGEGQVSGEGFAGESADDDLFVGGRHGLEFGSRVESGGLSHGLLCGGPKSCGQGSQYANVVLHLRFVPTRQDLDKHLIRLSLDAVFGRV